MNYLNLNIVKKHILVDQDFKDDDTYITLLSNTAEQLVEKYLDNKLTEIVNDNDGVLPSPIYHAMLLLVGTWYMTRESITFGNPQQIPHGVDALLSCYKNYTTSQI